MRAVGRQVAPHRFRQRVIELRHMCRKRGARVPGRDGDLVLAHLRRSPARRPTQRVARFESAHAAQQCLAIDRRLDEQDADEATPTERSEEHTSELQSQSNLVCRLLLEKKKKQIYKL